MAWGTGAGGEGEMSVQDLHHHATGLAVVGDTVDHHPRFRRPEKDLAVAGLEELVVPGVIVERVIDTEKDKAVCRNHTLPFHRSSI